MKKLFTISTLIFAYCLTLNAAETLKANSHLKREIAGKVWNFEPAFKLGKELNAAHGRLLLGSQETKREAQKDIKRLERQFRPWMPFWVYGNKDTWHEGNLIIKQLDINTRYTGRLIAVKNLPTQYSQGVFWFYAQPVGKIRYGGKQITLFDYGKPVKE